MITNQQSNKYKRKQKHVLVYFSCAQKTRVIADRQGIFLGDRLDYYILITVNHQDELCRGLADSSR